MHFINFYAIKFTRNTAKYRLDLLIHNLKKMSLFDLKNKSILITGSSRGIGKAIAHQSAVPRS